MGGARHCRHGANGGFHGIAGRPLWLVEVAEMAPQTAVASTIGFAMTLNMIAITLMPPIFGLVVDSSTIRRRGPCSSRFWFSAPCSSVARRVVRTIDV